MSTIIRDGWQGHTGMGLSLREVEFTLRVAAGLTDKQIARETGLAPDSVRKRIYNAMFKLGASRRPQLIAEAMRKAIIAPLVIALGFACIVSSAAPDSTTERAPRNLITRMTRGGARGSRRDPLYNPFDYV